MIEEFKKFVASAERLKTTIQSQWVANKMIEYEEMRVGIYHWSVESDLSDLDFNREVIHPDEVRDFPQGVVRIMCDDDFFIVAVLPYEMCINLDARTIVSVLYPETYQIIKDKTDAFKPDSDDPWWDEYFSKHDAEFTARIMKGRNDP